MEKLMSDQLSMFDPVISPDTHNATSSLVSVSGPTRSGSRDGQTTAPSGQEAAPVQFSAQQAKARGLQMLVTSGRIGSGSSASAALQSSLESRLVQRLDTAGSTLFKMIWRRRLTPLGRPYLERAASAHRTSDSACGSWPSPNMPSGGANAKSTAKHTGGMDLEGAATMASWPSPKVSDVNNDRRSKKSTEAEWNRENASRSSLPLVAKMLASWPTPRANDALKRGHLSDDARNGIVTAANLSAWASPSARDWKDTSGMALTGTNPDGSERTRLDQLPRQANLSGPARLKASGEMLIGSDARMENGCQLNPAHARWLMGLPPVFCACAVTAMQSMPKSRLPSSERYKRYERNGGDVFCAERVSKDYR